jgi:hypothetical protein
MSKQQCEMSRTAKSTKTVMSPPVSHPGVEPDLCR